MTDGPVYAYSDDLGDTFHRADGTRLELPLTVNPIPGHHAAMDFHSTRRWFDLWYSLLRHAGGVMQTGTRTAVLEEEDRGVVPTEFALSQNYPNPFNGRTAIRYFLPRDNRVELALYNLAGQKVATLVDGMRPAASHTVRWDGRDDAGAALASGVYLYRLQAGGREETRKLLLLK